MHLIMIGCLGIDLVSEMVCKDSTGVGTNAIHTLLLFVSPAATDNGVSRVVHGTAGTNDRATGRVVQLLASRF